MEEYKLLIVAISERNLNMVKLLLTKCGPSLVNQSNEGWTPIHEAGYRNGRPKIAKLLIESGANVNVRNDIGWSPLHVAAHYLNLEIAELLLKAGADPNAQRIGYDNATPLHYAFYYTDSDDYEKECMMVKLLLDHGADPYMKCVTNSDVDYSVKTNAIEIARNHDRNDIIKIFEEHQIIDIKEPEHN
jgi:ankyrin repeat protein